MINTGVLFPVLKISNQKSWISPAVFTRKQRLITEKSDRAVAAFKSPKVLKCQFFMSSS